MSEENETDKADKGKADDIAKRADWISWFCTLGLCAITVLAGVWLWKMTDALKSSPAKVEVCYDATNVTSTVTCVFPNATGISTNVDFNALVTITPKMQKSEEAQFALYKQAEEALREQMNTWLTIFGFFGVLLGLVVPLASYLLQKHSLSEERERIKEDTQRATEEAATKAAEKAATEAAEKATNAVKEDMQNQIEDIKKKVKNVDDLYNKVVELQGMVEDHSKTIKQVEQTTQQTTDELSKVKRETAKANQVVQSLTEAMSNSGKPGDDVPKGGSATSSKSEFEKTKQKAETGDAKAQCDLGWMYSFGKGVDKEDAFEAVYWYRKAANQGHAVAQYNLGVMYDFGRGVDENKVKAVYWYRKAAEQGYASAENNLGVMFEYGYGCEKNEREALKWYQRAAEHGDAMGYVSMGLVYEFGKLGVKQDLSKAKELYQQVLADPNASEEATKLAREGLDRVNKKLGGGAA